MTNEEWWANASYLKNGSYDFDKIVAEATRRGEVKAWEEARVIVEQQRLLACYPGIPQLKSGGIAYMRTLEEIDAKLTSLKTP